MISAVVLSSSRYACGESAITSIHTPSAHMRAYAAMDPRNALRNASSLACWLRVTRPGRAAARSVGCHRRLAPLRVHRAVSRWPLAYANHQEVSCMKCLSAAVTSPAQIAPDMPEAAYRGAAEARCRWNPILRFGVAHLVACAATEDLWAASRNHEWRPSFLRIG